jgi:hypothetical protein
MPQTHARQQRHRFRLDAASKAPKARSIPAWGVAPGTAAADARGLKARPICLIPQIPFVEFHSVFLEKCSQFILKRLLSMMDFLTIDVLDQRAQVTRPNRERTISTLPSKFRQIGRLGLEPSGRRRFELFHNLRHVDRAGQPNRKVNVVRDSSYTKAFAVGVAGDGSKVRVERRANGRIEKGGTVFCAEHYMDQNKRERLRHRVDYRSDFQPSTSHGHETWGFTPCWYRAAPLALSLSAVSILGFCLLLPSIALAQSPPLHIRVINAQTNKPVTNERLNVALRADQIGSVAMPTDKNGIILVDTGNATTIRILSNMYADCRPRGELYTDYSIATIRQTGITTGNLCSSAKPSSRPGVLVLYEIPKTYIPQFGSPPNSNLPHSDENPHQPQPQTKN